MAAHELPELSTDLKMNEFKLYVLNLQKYRQLLTRDRLISRSSSLNLRCPIPQCPDNGLFSSFSELKEHLTDSCQYVFLNCSICNMRTGQRRRGHLYEPHNYDLCHGLLMKKVLASERKAEKLTQKLLNKRKERAAKKEKIRKQLIAKGKKNQKRQKGPRKSRERRVGGTRRRDPGFGEKDQAGGVRHVEQGG